MTNFGNGYPERNMETDGFSFYDKCEVIAMLRLSKLNNDILSLVNHTNRYTDKNTKMILI